MGIGRACAIFFDIESSRFSDSEKLEAIKTILQFETINGVSKQRLVNVLRWTINKYTEAENEV